MIFNLGSVSGEMGGLAKQAGLTSFFSNLGSTGKGATIGAGGGALTGALAGGTILGSLGAISGLIAPGRDKDGKRKSRITTALKRSIGGTAIGAIGGAIPGAIIGGSAGAGTVLGAKGVSAAVNKYMDHRHEGGLGALSKKLDEQIASLPPVPRGSGAAVAEAAKPVVSHGGLAASMPTGGHYGFAASSTNQKINDLAAAARKVVNLGVVTGKRVGTLSGPIALPCAEVVG